jgi:TetR/AcrR family transcriptional regulator, transcriptional repressor for nem operon
MGQSAERCDEADTDLSRLSQRIAGQRTDSCLSAKHLGKLENQCPMIALPCNFAPSSLEVEEAYHKTLSATVWLFERSRQDRGKARGQQALAMAAL